MKIINYKKIAIIALLMMPTFLLANEKWEGKYITDGGRVIMGSNSLNRNNYFLTAKAAMSHAIKNTMTKCLQAGHELCATMYISLEENWGGSGEITSYASVRPLNKSNLNLPESKQVQEQVREIFYYQPAIMEYWAVEYIAINKALNSCFSMNFDFCVLEHSTTPTFNIETEAGSYKVESQAIVSGYNLK